MRYKLFNTINAAPSNATKIGVYDENGIKVGVIPLKHLNKTKGNELYRIGLISDIHVDSGDFNYSGGSSTTYWVGDEAEADLQRALTYFKNVLNVDFVCSAGDIGLSSTTSELQTYKNVLDTYASNLPVYTCTGNHDVYSSSYAGRPEFNTYTRRSVETNAHTLTNSDAYQNSFEFTHTVTYQGKEINDHYIFFSMYLNSPGSSGVPYLDADIDWLEDKLQEYKNERTFIFTHYYFPDYAGNLGRVNGAGGMYGSEKGLGGAQETRLVGLLSKYPNTIWFSGHTHWSWQMQEYQDNANIDRHANGAWTFHISSLAVPIDCTTYVAGGTNTASVNQYGRRAGSQAAYAIVYENGVEIQCIDFNTQAHLNPDGTCQGDTSTDNTAILPIGIYYLDTTISQLADEITLLWDPGYSIDSSTGDLVASSYRFTTTNYIKVTQGNSYYLSATNLGSNAGNINSISMYAYDANKNYLGRIAGPTIALSGSGNNYYYFDGSNDGSVSNYSDLDITEYLFDNDGTSSDGATTYTGNIAYVRIRISMAHSNDQITEEILTQVTMTEMNTMGVDNSENVARIYRVSKTLSSCTSSNTDSTASGSYTTTLNYDTSIFDGGLEVTITMGGTDITNTAWNSANNTISIANVTGNISITATAISLTAPTASLLSASDLTSMANGESKRIMLLNPSTTGYILGYTGTATTGDPDSFSSMSGGTGISSSTASSNLTAITNYVNTITADSNFWFTITKTSGGFKIASYNGNKEFYSSSTTSGSTVKWGTSGDWQISSGSTNGGSSNLVYGRSEQIWIKNSGGLWLASSTSSTATNGSGLGLRSSSGGWTHWLIYELS